MFFQFFINFKYRFILKNFHWGIGCLQKLAAIGSGLG
jgi:hypothetical protein